MNKENVTHICDGIILCHKKAQNSSICRNVDGLSYRVKSVGKKKTNTVN